MAVRTIFIRATRAEAVSTVVINRGPAGADGEGGGAATYAELTDAATVDLPTINTPLATALAALGGGGTLTYSSITDGATVDLPTVNTPLGTALSGKAPLSHTHTVSQITDFPTLAAVATSGAYADLTGQPPLVVNFGDLGDATTVDLPTVNSPLSTALGLKADASSLATVATSGSYSDLSGTPTLATVATTGDYGDLLNLPTLVVNFGDLGDATTVDLPTVNSPLSTALGLKADTSSLSTVATTGAYSDLSGTPTLATVATSGAYSDLTGTPTIPSGTQVEDYLVDDGIHTITSFANFATPDANNGRSQKFPLTENTTLNFPSNLADGQSMTIAGTQAATPVSFSIDPLFEVYGAGKATDVTALGSSEGFEIYIKRVGSTFRCGITTQQS